MRGERGEIKKQNQRGDGDHGRGGGLTSWGGEGGDPPGRNGIGEPPQDGCAHILYFQRSTAFWCFPGGVGLPHSRMLKSEFLYDLDHFRTSRFPTNRSAPPCPIHCIKSIARSKSRPPPPLNRVSGYCRCSVVGNEIHSDQHLFPGTLLHRPCRARAPSSSPPSHALRKQRIAVQPRS